MWTDAPLLLGGMGSGRLEIMANTYGSTIRTWVLGGKSFKISQTFKQHQAKGGFSKLYAGIDIATPVNVNIYAPDSGVCYSSFTDKDGANIITLKHKTCFTQYAHLLARLVAKGAKIKKGQLIGRTGRSGGVKPHLHMALLKNGKRVDPYAYLLSVSEPKSPQTVVKVVPSATSPIKTQPKTVLEVVGTVSGAESIVIPPSDTSTTKNSTIIVGGDVEMVESKRFELNTKDAKSIAVGALIAIGGALVAYFSDVISTVDFGKYAYIAAPLAAILLNALRKFLEGK